MLTVNGLEDARAALRTSREQAARSNDLRLTTHDSIHLSSPPYAACHAGVNYWRALLTQLQREFPSVPFRFTLCCGDNPAIAHDALRLGFTAIHIDCSEAMFKKLEAIAHTTGATVSRPHIVSS